MTERKTIAVKSKKPLRAEEAVQGLKETEQDYHDLYENAPIAYFSVGVDDCIRSCNRKAQELLGRTKEDLIGSHALDLYVDSPEGKEKAAKVFQRSRSGEEIVDEELLMRREDGTPLCTSLSVTPIRNASGDVVASRSMVEDTTKRKQAEEALRESEERYRDLFENTNDLVQSVAPDGSLVYVNRAWRQALGYSEDEIPELSLFDVIHPDSKAHCMEIFQRVMAGEKLDHVEAMFVTKNGTTICVEGNASCRFEDGKAVATRAIFHDITERKQIEEALRESEARHRLLAENVTDVIWTLDLNLRYTYMSPSVTRMRGYSPEEIVGSTVQETITPASVELARKTLAEELAMERMEHKDLHRSRTLELEMCCKDGSTVWTEVKMTGIRDSDGQLIGILGVTRDISERKRAEEELQRRNQELELFLDLSKELTGTLDEKQILRTGLDSTLRLVAADVAAVTQILPHKPYAETRASARGLLGQRLLKDLSTWILPAVNAMLDRPLSEETHSLSVVPTREAQRGAEIPALQSFVSMPLTAHDEIVGFICAGRQAAGDFDKPAIRALATLAGYLSVALQNSVSYQALTEINIQMIAALGSALETKDSYGLGHSMQKAEYAVALAKEMGLPSWQVQNVRLGALLHDIGKIGMDEDLLNKPSKLTKEEFELVKADPVLGADTIAKIDHLRQIVPIVRHHHERFDGSGYPDGLAGEAISEPATIVAVADAFDAMISDRPYRAARSVTAAVREIVKGSGEQFNPKVVEAILRLQKRKALPRPHRPVIEEQVAA
jgi:PAS domain S-box-containing protein/putative nucleotidyltransferase with HDIG domain